MKRNQQKSLIIAGRWCLLGVALLTVCGSVGCGTTRISDTQRTATEQLLVSNAIDQAVADINFQPLNGKRVYIDTQYLDGVVDKGYLISSLRQVLLASGCTLREEKKQADYVVEVRSGGIGTDRHAVLLGVPQMTVPTFVPGQPSMIPEIPFAKKTDQEGLAKLAVFAYNRVTGQPIWQSGMVRATSTSRDTWVLGAGPFQQGTIRNGMEFAGEQISIFPDKTKTTGEVAAAPVPLSQSAVWVENPQSKTDSKRLAVLLGAVPLSERPGAASTDQPISALVLPPVSAADRIDPDAAGKNDKSTAGGEANSAKATTANAGGSGESEPNKVMAVGLGSTPAPSTDIDADKGTDSGGSFTPEK